jgi:nucleoside-triphosphatase THEP1
LTQTSDNIEIIWKKAALLGSVWASIEILLGSFLHNIQFPLTGSLLASIGISLLVAGQCVWNDRGIIWRAGVVCALMKSISPSAVIFGPMIGITLEAAILEVSVRIAGRNIFGFLVGGGLAALMPLVQKIFNLIITYGFDFALLYVRVYDYAAKSLHIKSFGAVDLLLLFSAINITFGLTAVVVGLIVARRISSIDPESISLTKNKHEDGILSLNPAVKFSIPLLLMHVLIILVLLSTMDRYPLALAFAIILLYSLACLILYPSIRPRFRGLRLWIEFAGISLLAGLLLGELVDSQPGWHWSGLAIGMQMTFRAFVVIFGFSALSIEIRNPRIINWLLKRGLHKVTGALEISFGALPAFMAALGEEKKFLRHPVKSLTRILAIAVHSFKTIESGTPSAIKVFIITGKQGEGKTTLLAAMIQRLQKEGYRIGGILQPCVFKDGERIGYDVTDIASGTSVMLCRLNSIQSEIKEGKFSFLEEGVLFGCRSLTMDALRAVDLIIVDEVGPLELRGGGWYASLEKLLRTSDLPIVICVRESLINRVQEQWKIIPYLIFKMSDAEPDIFVGAVRKELMNRFN